MEKRQPSIEKDIARDQRLMCLESASGHGSGAEIIACQLLLQSVWGGFLKCHFLFG